MIICVLCYPASIYMSQLLSTGRPISSCFCYCVCFLVKHVCDVCGKCFTLHSWLMKHIEKKHTGNHLCAVKQIFNFRHYTFTYLHIYFNTAQTIFCVAHTL